MQWHVVGPSEDFRKPDIAWGLQTDWMPSIWSPRSNLDRYCPETGFFSAHGCVYSPQLGMTVAKDKPKATKPAPNKEHTGHVTLIK